MSAFIGGTGGSSVAIGTRVASLSSPQTINATVTATIHTLSFPAGSSRRYIIIASADGSPNDGTTSGYLYAIHIRTRRAADGTYTIDNQATWILNEYISTAVCEAFASGSAGSSALVVRGTAPATAAMTFTRCDVYEI